MSEPKTPYADRLRFMRRPGAPPLTIPADLPAAIDGVLRELEAIQAELAKVRAENDLMDRVIVDTAEEIGCEPDNEKMLFAVAEMKEQLAAQAAEIARQKAIVARLYGRLAAIGAITRDELNDWLGPSLRQPEPAQERKE